MLVGPLLDSYVSRQAPVSTCRGKMKDKPYLSIISAGLCTPVGTDLFSATAAIRAGLDHFRETHFETH